jgi:hypothetical protein
MQITNTSRYPVDEVRRLVALATTGVEMGDVAVNVKNSSRKAYGGRAYCGVPRLSPVRASYLITLHLGAPGRFPTSNLTEIVRWLPVGTRLPAARDAAAAKGGQLVQRTERDAWRRRRIRYGVVVRQPYGGRGSPLLELADWREALVVVAAHEAWHIHQFRTGLRRVEAECERFAATALARYRTERFTPATAAATDDSSPSGR